MNKLKVLCISQYPPVPNLPHGEVPINFALVRYASQKAKLYWIFNGAYQESSFDWKLCLKKYNVAYSTYFKHITFSSILEAIKRLLKGWHPKVCFEIIKYWYSQNKVIDSVIRTFQPDIIYLSSPFAAAMYKSRPKLPFIYNSIDSLTFAFEKGTFGGKRKIFKLVKHYWFHRMDKDLCKDKDVVIFVSKIDAMYAPYAPKERIYVIENGCDIERFRPVTNSNKPDDFIVVFVGAYTYRPNAEAIKIIIQEIAPRVWAINRTIKFRFIGKGNEQLPSLYSIKSDCMEFPGYVENLADELRKASIALIPLRSGAGIKNKVLDAMASGLPVVGLKEAFSGLSDIKGGILCKDPIECARWVIRLFQDHEIRSKMSLEARQFAESFSWKKQCDKYVKIWEAARAKSLS